MSALQATAGAPFTDAESDYPGVNRAWDELRESEYDTTYEVNATAALSSFSYLPDGQDGEPFRFPGWTLLGRFSQNHFQGQQLVVDAEVNTATHTIKAIIPGNTAPITVTSQLIQPRTHWVTLRASNSRVQYDLVQVQGM